MDLGAAAFNLTSIDGMAHENPHLGIVLKYYVLARKSANSEDYDNFCELVKRAINMAAQDMTHSRQMYTEFSEDELTNNIKTFLRGMTFSVSSEANGGNTDIFIRCGENYTWIGESKLWSGAESAKNGYEQLVTRYISGHEYQRRGALLIFNKDKAGGGVLESWRKKLLATSCVSLSGNGYQDEVDFGLSVLSDHATEFTSRYIIDNGGDVGEVWHKLINIVFKPADKSAKSSKKYSKTRIEPV